ncbi:MAG: hypothetical protein IPP91_06875 [Betaproteobacteria bacterium]|nr:hypothetical protein [Betaproteobacteria bacterium]
MSTAHYNYFRDYDPAIGRYIESDPFGLTAGLNTFTYVSSRPLKITDRRGLAADCPGCAGGGSNGGDAACCWPPKRASWLGGHRRTVMCCGGRKVSCANISGPEPGNSVLRKFVKRHEDRHVPDTVCLDCFSVHRAVFREGVT